MSIALIIPDRDVRPLQEAIARLLGGAQPVYVYPELPRNDDIEMAVLWKHPPSLLDHFPRLRLVSSLGAGVEHILSDPALPPGIRITRIVDEALTVSMRNYVLMCVLNIHKRFTDYLEARQQKRWIMPSPLERPLRIGILGLGALGGDIAHTLASLGFDTYGYSRSPRNIPGVQCFSAGDSSLPEFAARVNTLVCLLPRTPATENVLNYELFRHLPPGSALINVARGAHLAEPDLLRAFDEGFLREAYLDVFRQEPLPDDHPFWGRPGLIITPHIASVTKQENAARIVVENYRRMREGRELLFEVDRSQGY